MSIRFYMDVHVPRPITLGLRLASVDVLTARDDNHATADDDTLLDRATELGRVLFSQDEDLLKIARFRQLNGVPFAGVVYGHQQRVTIGRCVHDLELIAKVLDPTDMENVVQYVPI